MPEVRVGVILAGGESRRMGADKALLPVGGRPLLARLIAALRGAGLTRVVVSGRTAPDPAIAGLEAEVWLPDATPGAGPVAGLATVWAAHPEDLVVISCDLPAFSAEAARWLAAAPGLARVGDRPQFAVGRWPLDGRENLLRFAAQGGRALRGAAESAGLSLRTPPPGIEGALRQANDPETWAALLRELQPSS